MQNDIEIIQINISGADKPGMTSSLTAILARYDACMVCCVRTILYKVRKVLFFPANYPLFFTAGRPIISVFGGICLFLHANLSRETYVEFFLAGASRR